MHALQNLKLKNKTLPDKPVGITASNNIFIFHNINVERLMMLTLFYLSKDEHPNSIKS